MQRSILFVNMHLKKINLYFHICICKLFSQWLNSVSVESHTMQFLIKELSYNLTIDTHF